jgi:Domain of unknown function (DUF4145)
VWTDPAAAANGLRRCGEVLLDAQRIATTKAGSKGKVRLNTRECIQRLKLNHAVAADSLETVKRIGNQGSHGDIAL